jgi:hypothetical protein
MDPSNPMFTPSINKESLHVENPLDPLDPVGETMIDDVKDGFEGGTNDMDL